MIDCYTHGVMRWHANPWPNLQRSGDCTEPYFKATGFYLRGLSPLVPTDRLTPPRPGTDAHKAWSAVHRAPPGPDRWRFRSRTFEGVAAACAEQWGARADREVAA